MNLSRPKAKLLKSSGILSNDADGSQLNAYGCYTIPTEVNEKITTKGRINDKARAKGNQKIEEQNRLEAGKNVDEISTSTEEFTEAEEADLTLPLVFK